MLNLSMLLALTLSPNVHAMSSLHCHQEKTDYGSDWIYDLMIQESADATYKVDFNEKIRNEPEKHYSLMTQGKCSFDTKEPLGTCRQSDGGIKETAVFLELYSQHFRQFDLQTNQITTSNEAIKVAYMPPFHNDLSDEEAEDLERSMRQIYFSPGDCKRN